MKIVLFAGGWSSEREVSLKGAHAIHASLQELGHTVILCDISIDISECISLLQHADFAFINVHGKGGEDGLLPALAEHCGVPYQCANAQGSFLALNKSITKAIYHQYGLPTSPYMVYRTIPEHIALENYPLFVKEDSGGSSLGLYRVENEKEAIEAIGDVLSIGELALVEERVIGSEITCGVLGERALPPVLIRPMGEDFFTYETKYTAGSVEEICPAPIPNEQYDIIMQYAYKAHTILGLFGYSRTDMILQENGIPMLLETNTIPGMTQTSLLPQEAQAVGISFTELIAILIQQGIERHTKRISL